MVPDVLLRDEDAVKAAVDHQLRAGRAGRRDVHRTQPRVGDPVAHERWIGPGHVELELKIPWNVAFALTSSKAIPTASCPARRRRGPPLGTGRIAAQVDGRVGDRLGAVMKDDRVRGRGVLDEIQNPTSCRRSGTRSRSRPGRRRRCRPRTSAASGRGNPGTPPRRPSTVPPPPPDDPPLPPRPAPSSPAAPARMQGVRRCRRVAASSARHKDKPNRRPMLRHASASPRLAEANVRTGAATCTR